MTRQPDFATHPSAARVSGWASVLLLAGVLAAALVGGLSWRLREQASEASSSLAAVRREVEQQGARLRALEGVHPANPAASATPLRVVAALAAVLPADARLERLAIDYTGGPALEMQVAARTPEAWDRTVAALERSPHLRDVEIGPESRESPLSVAVHARWSEGAR